MNKVTMTVNKCNIKIDYKGKSNINWQRKVNKGGDDDESNDEYYNECECS